jgi:membrane protease YdiL (CAAX protease family)
MVAPPLPPGARLNALFLDPQRRLRNGWWLLAFMALFIGSRQIYTPTVRLLKEAGVAEAWLEPMPFLFVLMVTAICTTLRAESLASVGFRLDRRWFVQFAAGSVAGAASIALIAVIVATTGALSLSLDPARSIAALAHGAWVFLCVALFEEALFRGFAFQRVVAGAGIGVAQVVFALLFAVAHWDNPGMDGWGRTVASVDIALGALLYGLAWWRTGSLALPIGLHFG